MTARRKPALVANAQRGFSLQYGRAFTARVLNARGKVVWADYATAHATAVQALDAARAHIAAIANPAPTPTAKPDARATIAWAIERIRANSNGQSMRDCVLLTYLARGAATYARLAARASSPPQLTDIATRARQIIDAAEHDGLTIDDGNVVDLLANNIPRVPLNDLRSALVVAGLAARFPRAHRFA